MTEEISDKQTWTRIAISIGTLVVIMLIAITVSNILGG